MKTSASTDRANDFAEVRFWIRCLRRRLEAPLPHSLCLGLHTAEQYERKREQWAVAELREAIRRYESERIQPYRILELEKEFLPTLKLRASHEGKFRELPQKKSAVSNFLTCPKLCSECTAVALMGVEAIAIALDTTLGPESEQFRQKVVQLEEILMQPPAFFGRSSARTNIEVRTTATKTDRGRLILGWKAICENWGIESSKWRTLSTLNKKYGGPINSGRGKGKPPLVYEKDLQEFRARLGAEMKERDDERARQLTKPLLPNRMKHFSGESVYPDVGMHERRRKRTTKYDKQ